MIPSFAIREYLNQRRDDHRWMKKLRVAEVDDILHELYPRPKLHPKLRLSQKIGFLLGISYPRFLFFYDLGLGKSLLTLELMRYWFQCEQIERGLIFVKTNKAYPTWEKMFERFEIKLPYIFLEDSSDNKWQQLACLDRGLAIVPYPSAVHMTHKLMRVERKGKKPKNELVMLQDRVEQLRYWADGVVFDESTLIGHRDSCTSQLASSLADNDLKICYGLAGRPFGRDPTPLFTQMKIIDKGASLGTALGLFQAAFFSSEDNPFSTNKYSKKHTFLKKKLPILKRLYQHRSMTYRSNECIDVPRVVPIQEEVRLPGEVSSYYHKCVQQVVAARRDVRKMKSIFIQMRQLSSGFLAFKTGPEDNEEKIEFDFPDKPKLDRTLELLEEIPEDHSAVVFYEFTHSGRKLSQELAARKLDHVWLWGGTKNPIQELKRFLHDPDCRYIILNNKVGAYSLDGLQEKANYLFFYESPVSCIDREQAVHRVVRSGQKSTVFLYDMLTRGTVDSKILAFHKEGTDIMDALRSDPESVLLPPEKFTLPQPARGVRLTAVPRPV